MEPIAADRTARVNALRAFANLCVAGSGDSKRKPSRKRALQAEQPVHESRIVQPTHPSSSPMVTHPEAAAPYDHNSTCIDSQIDYRMPSSTLRFPSDVVPDLPEARASQKWVIMPFAFPGMGRSAIVAGLAHIFGFPIARSESFLDEWHIRDELATNFQEHDIVIADSDTHVFRHRVALRKATPDLRVLCLNWDVSGLSFDTVHDICLRRILESEAEKRGAIPYGLKRAISGDIWRFFDEYEEFEDSEAHAIMTMSVNDDLRRSLQCAVGAIVELFAASPPSAAKFFAALEVAHQHVEDGPSYFDAPRVTVPVLPKTTPANLATSARSSFRHLEPRIKESTTLVRHMQEIALEQPRSVSSRTFSVADGSSVTNWRVAKSAYYNSSFTLPTKIRGLWTRQLPRSSDDEEHSWEIVARGYDKFYEVDEVSWLSWDSIYHNTVGPHYVTIKSNGSLVLISALTPQKLLVTSKNSVGRNASRPVSHSMKAEEWLETHLNAVGKSPRELAFLLWRQNWSLVCELCDDSFEEHVLEVPVESSGLHLHGINKRQVVFCTECPDVVHAFALEWGFFPTPYETFDDMLSVNAYISDLTSPGKWKGPPIEGFVVRTKVAPVANTPDARSREHPVPRLPLPAGQPLFVKIKFSEPYLLYRALREITKCVLQKRPVTHFVTMANGSFHGPLPVTRAYAGWITKRIHEDRSSFKGIALGHGIHATRNLFFQWSRTEAGQEALHDEELRWRTEVYSPLPPVANQHWIIVFVGPPGCGKTALSVALAHLFGFKHVQYDKIKAKRKKTVKANFLGMMKMWSAKQVTVLADASSSLRKHRRDIRDAATSTHPVAKVMAFHWALRADSTDVMSRTLSRRVGLSEDDARKTVDRFVLLHEPLRDAEVDAAVALDYDASLEASLALAIRAVCDHLQLSLPDATEIWEALEIARDPSNHVVKHGSSHETTVPHPTYYALVPQGNLLIAIECYVLTNNPPTSFTTVLERARQNDGSDPLLFRRPHITLVHEAQLHAQDSHALWRLCSAVDTPIWCQVTVKRLIYDDRLIVAPIETLQGDGDTANDFIRHIASSIVQRLHIVVARCRADIQPVEAHALLDAWRGGTSAVKTVFFTQEVTTIARLRGIAGSSNAQKSPCT